MYIGRNFNHVELAYRDVKTGAFIRSRSYNNFVHVSLLEDIINQNLNDLVDIYTSKWFLNKKTGEWFSAPYFDVDSDNLEMSYTIALRLYHYLRDKYKFKVSFVFSGAKGFHIDVHEGNLSLESYPRYDAKFLKWFARKVARELKIEEFIDFKVYEKKRLWRLPKTINSKSGLFCHRIPENKIGKWSIEDILEYAKFQQDYPLFYHAKVSTFGKKKLYEDLVEYKTMITKTKEKRLTNRLSLDKDELPPCIMSLLEKTIPEGKRNITLYTVARALNKLYNLTVDDIYNFLYNWASESGMGNNEIYPTINSACQSEEDFSCLGSAYINSLVSDGVAHCPYQGKTAKETRILKMTLCPIYRTVKSNLLVEKIRGKYENNLQSLYNDLKEKYKAKDWGRAREIVSSIYLLKTKIVEEVKKSEKFSYCK